MAACSLVTHDSNHKNRRLFLIGLLSGIALYMLVYLPTYLSLEVLKSHPLYNPGPGKQLLQQTEDPTTVPPKNARPTRPPGPVHPTPFNVTNPISGYVNVLKDKEPLKLHCRDCALVFNSAHVLHHEAGSDIDKSECVIRLNDAPVIGFEKHVGARTTVRVVGHTSVPIVSKNRAISTSDGLKVVGWGPDETMRMDGKGETYNNLSKLAKDHPDNIQVYMLTPLRMVYADKVFENETGKPRAGSGSWLSTGWFAMILATEMCDQVKVYGMSSGDYCRNPDAKSVPYHYFGNDTRQECKEYKASEERKKGAHRFLTEKTVFKRWSQYHNISFNFPTW